MYCAQGSLLPVLGGPVAVPETKTGPAMYKQKHLLYCTISRDPQNLLTTEETFYKKALTHHQIYLKEDPDYSGVW